MLSKSEIQEAAKSLVNAEYSREWTEAISTRFPKADVQDAYSIAQHVKDLKLEKGRQVKGHKIGLTSKAMQALSNSTEPDYGFIFDDWFALEGDVIDSAAMNRPMVEVELAFVFREPLYGPSVNAADVIRATDFILPTLELIDSRYRTLGDNLLVDSIADGASCGRIVLGANPIDLKSVDIRRIGASLAINGDIIETGTAAAVMGNPVNAVVWLANKLITFDEYINAGDVVLSGSFVRARPLNQGDSVTAQYDQFGEITIRLE